MAVSDESGIPTTHATWQSIEQPYMENCAFNLSMCGAMRGEVLTHWWETRQHLKISILKFASSFPSTSLELRVWGRTILPYATLANVLCYKKRKSGSDGREKDSKWTTEMAYRRLRRTVPMKRKSWEEVTTATMANCVSVRAGRMFMCTDLGEWRRMSAYA